MKKVLVTGGSGFIGKYVVEELFVLGYEPLVLDRHRDSDSQFSTMLGDIRDETDVTEAMAHADGWIHLAGVLGTQETIKNPRPAAHTNVLGGLNVLAAAAQYGVPGVNIAVGNHWMSNTYSITKSTVERFCEMYRTEHGLPVTTVRALNAYGPRQSVAAPYGSSKVRKIMPSFVHRAMDGKPIQIYGTGDQIMDMIHVRDVAQILVRALEVTAYRGPADEIISAGTGRPTTVNDIASIVREIVNEVCGVPQPPVEHLPMRPGEPNDSTVLGDPKTLEAISLNSSWMTRLEDGVEETVRHYAENFFVGDR